MIPKKRSFDPYAGVPITWAVNFNIKPTQGIPTIDERYIEAYLNGASESFKYADEVIAKARAA
jgi:hypothetical protein